MIINKNIMKKYANHSSDPFFKNTLCDNIINKNIMKKYVNQLCNNLSDPFFKNVLTNEHFIDTFYDNYSTGNLDINATAKILTDTSIKEKIKIPEKYKKNLKILQTHDFGDDFGDDYSFKNMNEKIKNILNKKKSLKKKIDNTELDMEDLIKMLNKLDITDDKKILKTSDVTIKNIINQNNKKNKNKNVFVISDSCQESDEKIDDDTDDKTYDDTDDNIVSFNKKNLDPSIDEIADIFTGDFMKNYFKKIGDSAKTGNITMNTIMKSMTETMEEQDVDLPNKYKNVLDKLKILDIGDTNLMKKNKLDYSFVNNFVHPLKTNTVDHDTGFLVINNNSCLISDSIKFTDINLKNIVCDNIFGSSYYPTDLVDDEILFKNIFCLKEVLKTCTGQVDDQLSGLINHIKTKFALKIEEIEQDIKAGHIAYNDLWYYLRDNEPIYSKGINNEIICGIKKSYPYIKNKMYIEFEKNGILYDGTQYVIDHSHVRVSRYNGKKLLTQLNIFPLMDDIKQMLMDRGTKYIKYVTSNSMIIYNGCANLNINKNFAVNRIFTDDFFIVNSCCQSLSYNKINLLSDDIKIFDGDIEECKYLLSPYLNGYCLRHNVTDDYTLSISNITEYNYDTIILDNLNINKNYLDMIKYLVTSKSNTKFLFYGNDKKIKKEVCIGIADRLKQPYITLSFGRMSITNSNIILQCIRWFESLNGIIIIDDVHLLRQHNLMNIVYAIVEIYKGYVFLLDDQQIVDKSLTYKCDHNFKFNTDNNKLKNIWHNELKNRNCETEININLEQLNLNEHQIVDLMNIVDSVPYEGTLQERIIEVAKIF